MPKCEFEFAEVNGAKMGIEKKWKGLKKRQLGSVPTRQRFCESLHRANLRVAENVFEVETVRLEPLYAPSRSHDTFVLCDGG